jgi:glycerol-3-phosphate acyltransferase PlsY
MQIYERGFYYMNLLLIAVSGYLFGSIPTAYLVLRKKGINILQSGSGNVGTMNALRVSGSKTTGIIVFTIDLLKGLIAVYLTGLIFGRDFTFMVTSLLFAVAGHCFTPWLKFKGGRGLATALGGSVIIAPVIPGLWILLWVATYIYKKNVHFANASATFLLLLLVIFSTDVLAKYSLVMPQSNTIFSATISVLLFIILVKHYNPLKQYFDKEKKNILRNK